MATSSSRPLFFRHAAQLLTLAGAPIPRRGLDLGELGMIPDGGMLTCGTTIVLVGPTSEIQTEARRLRAQEINCRGRVVMPGFVDCHTHAIFAGSRTEDFEQRIRGKSYAEIARAGGGIALTARLVRRARPEQLVAQARRFLREMAAHGTTTVEVKSGYGLDPANEIKILRVLRRLQRVSPIELVPTLLAAHALPPAYAGRPEAYAESMIKRLVPVVAREKLAEFVDCFCDRGAFGVAAGRRLLRAGIRHGLIPRVHAEQLFRTGASQMAIELGAASADHLDRATAQDIRALARSDTVAVLLPGANFHLGLRKYPPARKLIGADAAVALATDFNPGTSPTLNMQFILSLASTEMHMTPAEAICAATINAAYSLRRAHRLGSLEPGKQADLLVMDVADYREIAYYFAWNHCVLTVKLGKVIYHSRGGVSPPAA